MQIVQGYFKYWQGSSDCIVRHYKGKVTFTLVTTSPVVEGDGRAGSRVHLAGAEKRWQRTYRNLLSFN